MSSSPRLAGSGALAASVVLHGLLLATGAWLLSRSLSRRAPTRAVPHAVEVTLTGTRIELPRMSLGGARAAADVLARRRAASVPRGGGFHTPRPDMRRAGRGGADRVAQAALNLADSNDGITLNRDPLDRLDRSQVQRVRSSHERRTLDDRRATPHPMQLTFLASGSGVLPIRRAPAESDPEFGVRRGSLAPTALGARVGGPALEHGDASELLPGAQRSGATRAVDALGAPDASSSSHQLRRSARVMLARPWVRRSRAAVPAPARGRPNDDVDSSQAVASAVESLVHASTAGARRSGAGPGGEAAPGPVGSGGRHGSGSRSSAAGSGPGALSDVGRDSGALGYFGNMQSKLEPYWRHAFPTWAIAEGLGGMAIVGVTLSPEGRVQAVTLVRPSGVSEFDRNVMAAVERAGPFGPVPRVFGRHSLRVNVAFDATNPVVGRQGPGPGHYP
jgi:TonB family protein